jgi:hypothetical protein
MSATVFAGASQFVVIGLWTERLSIAAHPGRNLEPTLMPGLVDA